MKTICSFRRFSFVLAAVAGFSASAARAANWYVDNNPTTPALPGHFTTLAAAHAAAADGDTVYFAGSAAAYNPMTVTKRLNLVGVGYFLPENGITSVNTNNAYIIGLTTFATGAAGSTVTGLGLQGILIEANNVAITRCSATNVEIIAGISGAVIRQCYGVGYYYARGTGSVISNCIMAGVGLFGVNNTATHCVLGHGDTYAVQGVDTNNILTNSIILNSANNHAFSGSVFNCLCAQNKLPAGNGNIISAANFFTGGSLDMQFRLAVGSPAIGTGIGGADMGAFGGPTPYLASGLPPRPRIKALTSGGISTTTTGLRVHIEAESKN